MSCALLVIKAGIATTVQDLGRPGYRAVGVPRSGALDTFSMKLANLIVGNPPETGTLEMLYSGVSIAAKGGAVRIALAGAEATIQHDADRNLVRHLVAFQSHVLHDGERLRVSPIRDTAAAYLAVEGGFAIEPVLGSVSTYTRAGFGGWQGRALRAGDVLPLLQRHAVPRPEQRLGITPSTRAPGSLRIMPGPDCDRFTKSAWSTVLGSEYIVSARSDRSGLRLQGNRLTHSDGYDATSQGIAPGTIQVPGSGEPVILIGDQPTVGGYPVIATIISADLPAAGRLRIGAPVRFAAVGVNEAAEARAELSAHWTLLSQSLIPTGAS